MRLSHREWIEQKEREIEDKRYEAMLEQRRKSLQKAARRDQSKREFDNWLLHKDSYERAVTLLEQLSDMRRQERHEWFQVAVALNAVDALRGVTPTSGDTSSTSSKTTLSNVFYKWSREGFEFLDVPVSEELAKTFTLNSQEIMSEYAEQQDKKGQYIIPSLKYSRPKVKQAATDKRNLNNPDTKIYNRIYSKLLKSEYLRAYDEMREKLDKAIARMEGIPFEKAERRALGNLGLNRLAKWVEEDAMTKEEIERRRKEEDRSQNKKIHQGFVARKDRMRIRLPEAEEVDEIEDERLRRKSKVLLGKKENASSLNMTFSKGKSPSVRRKSIQVSNTSVDLLAAATTPRKYVYATNRDDLENSRRKLAKEGFVHRENFKDEDGDMLESEYRSAKAQTQRDKLRQLIEERERKAEDAYQQWKIQKDIRARALEALKYIAKPASLGDSKRKCEEHWEFVGEQLKSIDNSLFQHWSDWSGDFKTAGQCKVKWDALPPKQCDTCCPSSLVHNTLLKLLNRPGTSFVEIFDFAVDRKLRENMASDGRDFSDATEEERAQVEDTLELNPKKFRKMMLDAGIKLHDHEVRILTTLFDQDGDGLISRKEFLRFSGYEPRPGIRGDALQWLRGGEFCCWESCCHVTGLSSAYDVKPSSQDSEENGNNSNYDSDGFESENELMPRAKSLPLRLCSGKVKKGWVREPLPDLEKRVRKLLKMGDRSATDFMQDPPRSCEFATWTNEQRLTALDGLETLAERYIPIVPPTSSAPLAPTLTASVTEDTIELSWGPQKDSSFVAFFELETSGREGSKRQRSHDFKLLLRDPPKLSPNAKQVCKFVWKDRKPGTRYFFRIRAYNSFGTSPFTHVSFLTAPSQPTVPVIKSITPTTVTLSWGGIDSSVKTVTRELRDVFLSLDTKSAGAVDREDLLNLLETRHQKLFKALENIPSASLPDTSILDMLETNGEGDRLQWTDVHGWLRQAGAKRSEETTTSKQQQPPQREFQFTLCKCISDEIVDVTKEGALGKGRTSQDIATSALKGSRWFMDLNQSTDQQVLELPKLYAIEFPMQASKANEKPALKAILAKSRQKTAAQYVGNLVEPVAHLEVYDQVYVGFETTTTVTGLEPGKTYQFRLTKSNPEQGVASRMSQALIIHMPHVGPEPPRARKDSISTDAVHLVWGKDALERRDSGKNWTQVVGDWVKDPIEQNTGVSVATLQKMFMRYDRDGNKTLDSVELVELFKDLGLPWKGPGFHDALQVLDADRDGKVSFEEFYKWWNASGLKFVLLHRVGQGEGQSWNMIYRGDKQWAKLSGLAPNTLHSFVLQVERNKTMSAKSKELNIWTAPETPQQPVVVEAGPKHCRIKWYPGLNGAEKYVIELTLVETLGKRSESKFSASSSSTPSSSFSKKKTQEITVSKTLVMIPDLLPETVYRIRVKALNKDGLASSSSLPTQFQTQSSSVNFDRLTSETNAPNYFVIECAGDVVSGDTVLFTERVFKNAADQKEKESSSSTTATRQRGRKPRSTSDTAMSSLSQQSLSTLSKTEMGKVFISERTVAARCVGVVPGKKGFSLQFEVIWSSLSRKDCPQEYVLRPGLPIQRNDYDIFKFETFRAAWLQEQSRWNFVEEQEHQQLLQQQQHKQ